MAAAAPRSVFKLTMEDGAQIDVRRGGNCDGVRLFISHGNGFAVDGYRVFWEPLLERFDVILFDMRNHGRNEPCGADGHNYKQLARDLGSVFHGVAERLGDKPSVGVFHSMTARCAMKHAAEMEWVWDALVLFDPPNVPPRDHGLYEVMKDFDIRMVNWALGRRDSFASIDELQQVFATSQAQSRWLPQSHADMARAILRPDGAGKFTLVCRRELEASIYFSALTFDLWPPASAFAGPVKLIGADPKPRSGPPSGLASRALAEEGGYEYEFVPETGHLLQIERPEECREAMLSFLRAKELL